MQEEANQKKPTFFDAVCKEARDLFGLDLRSFKDKKKRARLITKTKGVVGDCESEGRLIP